MQNVTNTLDNASRNHPLIFYNVLIFWTVVCAHFALAFKIFAWSTKPEAENAKDWKMLRRELGLDRQ